MLGDALGGDDAFQPLSALFRESGVGTGGAFNQFWSERELRDLTTSSPTRSKQHLSPWANSCYHCSSRQPPG